jgi:hypothetical protein
MNTVSKLTAMSSLAVGVMLLNPVTASAGLIYDASIVLSAQGFGAAPRDLTVDGSGFPNPVESGCVSVTGGGIAIGPTACAGDALFMGNGVVNVGGQEPQPDIDGNKFGAPLASDRGIDSADDIGILFNATEPAANSINVTDITLKFFLNGALIGSIDGSQNFLDSNAGNGVAGFVFTVDAAQTDYVNGLLAQGNVRFALESTLDDSAGGPESFRIVNLNGPGVTPLTVPDGGATLLLLGAALGGLGAARRFTKS